MSSNISPDNERFIDAEIAAGRYGDRVEALDDAIELLRQRKHLLDHIDIGARQLESGQYTDYDQNSLRELFDEIQTEGRILYQSSKNGT